MGPSQPSCNPLIYSFQACRPSIKSPFTPLQSLIPIESLTSWMPFSLVSSSSLGGAFSPDFPRSFLTRSASPALSSPSFRPSTTSQSSPPATKIGFTYSLKCSRTGLRLSPGGAERYTVIFRGIILVGRASAAAEETNALHFRWARRFWYRSYERREKKVPVMERNMSQFREGRRARMFSRPIQKLASRNPFPVIGMSTIPMA